jgi:hypothetical protein
MATTTTNFGWDIPQSTDLVKDGATAIAALGQDIDTALIDLKGGTTGQVLSKASNTDLDYTWVTDAAGDITGVTAGTGISGGGTSGTVTVTNSMATAIDAKGDLVVGTGADAFSRLAVGTNTYVLTADSAEATGMKWAAAAGGSTYAGVSVYLSAGYSLANATGVIVPWTLENFDTDGYHDNTTNNSRLTVPAGKAGKYLVCISGIYTANATGTRATSIRLNGTTYVGNDGASICGAGDNQGTTVAKILNLSVGDYVEVDAFQSSGGSLNFVSGLNQSSFSMSLLGA